MKAKVISVYLFLLLAIGIPLLGAPQLIVSPYMFILTLAAVILLMTQPAITVEDAKQHKASDRHSVVAIMLGSVLSIGACVMEWGYWRQPYQDFPPDLFSMAGFMLMVLGVVFRIWSIRTLGQYFTSTVKVQAEQQVIQTGPHRVIRHPSYLGAMLAILGSGMMLHAYIGMMVSAIIMFSAYVFRIRVEEEKLLREFGQEYGNYQRRTKRMIPLIY